METGRGVGKATWQAGAAATSAAAGGVPASLEGPDHIVAAVALEAGHLQPQNAAPVRLRHCKVCWGGAPGGRGALDEPSSNLATRRAALWAARPRALERENGCLLGRGRRASSSAVAGSSSAQEAPEPPTALPCCARPAAQAPIKTLQAPCQPHQIPSALNKGRTRAARGAQPATAPGARRLGPNNPAGEPWPTPTHTCSPGRRSWPSPSSR